MCSLSKTAPPALVTKGISRTSGAQSLFCVFVYTYFHYSIKSAKILFSILAYALEWINMAKRLPQNKKMPDTVFLRNQYQAKSSAVQNFFQFIFEFLQESL